MQKIVVPIIVIIVVVAGAFAIFHKSSKPAATGNSSTARQSSALAVNNAVLITKTNASLGQFLAEPNGKPLYTYNADTKGVSNCSGSCLSLWPAYVDTGSTSNLPAGISTIKRSDTGQNQYTYNGLPLYTFVSDSGSQVTGNGVQNFSIAKPMAASSSTSNTTPAQPNTSGSGNPY